MGSSSTTQKSDPNSHVPHGANVSETEERAYSSDSVSDTELLAKLNERQSAIVQTQKIKEMSVKPGVMEVPVKEVTTAENSKQWVIIMDHPVEEDIRFFVPKPRTGWSHEYLLVRLLDWYEITDRNTPTGTPDPYALQARRLYIEYDDIEESWELIRPPTAHSRIQRIWNSIGNRVRQIRRTLPSMDRTALVMYAFIQIGILMGAIISALIPASVGFNALVGIGIPAIWTLVGLVVTDP